MFHSAQALCSSLFQRFARLFRTAKWARWALAAGLCGGLVIAGAQSLRAFSPEGYKKWKALYDAAVLEKQDRPRIRFWRGIFAVKPQDDFAWGFVGISTNAYIQPQLHAATTPLGPDLSVFAPTAAFRGNQTMVIGGVLETPPGRGDSVLVRASGCSLAQYAYPDLSAIDSIATVNLNGVEPYFRQLAGLAAAPASYPKGCADRALGHSFNQLGLCWPDRQWRQPVRHCR